jgi:hypothetical protein
MTEEKKDNQNGDQPNDEKNIKKINSLKAIIEEAEKSLFSARAMLQRLEGKANGGSVNKKTYGASPDGKIIEGIFDGQLMIGNDGKQYPVPANYASKSKLVEGDMLKLTITDEGNFVYKQIGPVERKRLIGIVKEDESGNFIIDAEGKIYKVLLASITYYKAEPGDEVTIVLPKDGEAIWCSIENVTKKAIDFMNEDNDYEDYGEETQRDPFMKEEAPAKAKETESDDKSNQANEIQSAIVDEWTPSLSKIEEEAQKIKDDAKKLEKEEKKLDEEEKSEAPKTKKQSKKKSVVTKDFPDTPEEVFNK